MLKELKYLTTEVLPAIVSPTGTSVKILQDVSFSFSSVEKFNPEMSFMVF